MNEHSAIEIGAHTAVDQRGLLLVLGKAIDEEIAAVMGGDRSSARSERDRMRVGYLCTLTGRIRDMNPSDVADDQVRPDRRRSRTL